MSTFHRPSPPPHLQARHACTLQPRTLGLSCPHVFSEPGPAPITPVLFACASMSVSMVQVRTREDVNV